MAINLVSSTNQIVQPGNPSTFIGLTIKHHTHIETLEIQLARQVAASNVHIIYYDAPPPNSYQACPRRSTTAHRTTHTLLLHLLCLPKSALSHSVQALQALQPQVMHTLQPA